MIQLIRILPVTSLLSATGAFAAERPPNFIFVLSDDIAQGDLGATAKSGSTPRCGR